MIGDTLSHDDAMKQFRAAWDVYASDPDRIGYLIEHHAYEAESEKTRGKR
ncbi:hypothetical protein KQX62_17055 [Rhodopseudomonas palustris]|uniref:Uncharacterized protein n=1 Tax=Rhodopseudomonas palustris TaxID=1076 RepID=A0AAX3DVJ3_RHOPL|nr:hypothetical protein [Rhodopseudomonas palustris]UYO38422.1 hypothetical protein KQX62_17055 [Rhodopseudomonas palustris]